MIKCREKTAKATVLSNDSLEKTPTDGKGRRQEEKGATEDEMVGWHHQLNGHEFEQAQPGVLQSTGVAKSRTRLSL